MMDEIYIEEFAIAHADEAMNVDSELVTAMAYTVCMGMGLTKLTPGLDVLIGGLALMYVMGRHEFGGANEREVPGHQEPTEGQGAVGE